LTSAAVTAAPPRVRRRRGLSPLARREARWGLLFISPWLIGFFAFTFVPMLVTLGFTFTNVNLTQTQPLRFVGLENYQAVFSDASTWQSLTVTLKYEGGQRQEKVAFARKGTDAYARREGDASAAKIDAATLDAIVKSIDALK